MSKSRESPRRSRVKRVTHRKAIRLLKSIETLNRDSQFESVQWTPFINTFFNFNDLSFKANENLSSLCKLTQFNWAWRSLENFGGFKSVSQGGKRPPFDSSQCLSRISLNSGLPQESRNRVAKPTSQQENWLNLIELHTIPVTVF